MLYIANLSKVFPSAKINSRIDIGPKAWQRFFFMACLMANQNFSIGFKSGEYGGKNKTLHPTLSINFLVLSD